MKPIYLHTNTEYSFLSSTIRVAQLFELAEEKKLEYLALTDKENLFALPYFLNFAKQNSVKLIIGVEIILDNNYSVLVYARNYTGYTLLNKMILKRSNNLAISLEDLDDESLLIVNHQHLGLPSNYQGTLPRNFYWNAKKQLNNQKTVFAPTKKILRQDDNDVLRTLYKIAQKEADNHFYGDFYNELDFKDVQKEVADEIDKFLTLIESFEISSEIKQAKIPNAREVFVKSINLEKYNKLIKKHSKEIVDQRIKYETEVIEKLQFLDYFLVIKDILDFARNNQIEVGAGRGSAAGSIVAFLLDITNVNPLEYGLLFERFLNIARVSLPDIDIDIQDDKRQKLLEYIRDRFGEERVALISTFQTLAAKSSIRDAARTLGIPLHDVDKISNSLTSFDQSLIHAYQRNAKYKMLVDKHPNLHKIASRIEGLPRQNSIHPAGIIICDRDLTEVVPIRNTNLNINAVEFDLNVLESYGLIKIDFLGLKNLTIVHQIEKQIQPEYRFDNVIDLNFNPIDDLDTYKVINQGNTEGIFQLESPGMTSVIKKVEVNQFKDLYAIISLYRPGPKDFIPQYANVKHHHESIESIWPSYDQIVAPTFGIIVYQEQIMQIAQQVANMSFGEADLLRRAISKKDNQKMHKYLQIFFENGLKNKVPKDILERIYGQIERFAAYGFNKAHAVAYAFLSYKLAFYKAHYPEIFYKVLIDNSLGDLSAIKKYARVASDHGIAVYSPKINNASYQCVISWKDKHKQSSLLLPIIMIKGIGSAVAQKIYQAVHELGVSDNIYEQLFYLKAFGVGDAALLTLVKANVFRDYGNINEMINVVPYINNAYDIYKKLYENSDQPLKEKISNFMLATNFNHQKIMALDIDITQEMAFEKELLGSIYNANPTIKYEREKKLAHLEMGKNNYFYVYLESTKKNAKGNIVAKISDSSTTLDAFVFGEIGAELHQNNKARVLVVLLALNEKGYYQIRHFNEVKDE